MDPTAAPYIRIDDISKKFGEFVAVDDVSLSIYKGEIFCLLGSSGCGKTTLLRMLAGFETPTEGRIFIDGVDMADVPPYERPHATAMFQSVCAVPAYDGRAERRVRLLEAGRVAAYRDRNPRRRACSRIVKLDQFAKRKPHQLSGGQRQRRRTRAPRS